MSNQERGKYLIKNTFIFALGNMGTRLINFFMVPFYTYVLSTRDYGIIDLLTSIGTIAVSVVMCNIGESVRRYLLDNESNDDEIFTIEFIWIVVGLIISFLFYFILSRVNVVASYSLEISTYIFSSAFVTTILEGLRGKELLIQYSVCSIIQTVLVAGLNILLLGMFNYGIKGYLWSFNISFLITAIIAFFVGKQYKYLFRLNFNKKVFSEMSRFSLTLVPNSIMWWVTSFSDRLLITWRLSPSANGIYNVSYKLPTMISVFNTILMQAWQYSAIKESESKDSEYYNQMMYNIYLAILSLATGFLLIINRGFMSIYVSAQYFEAWKYTPYLIVGFMFSSMSTFVGTEYFVKKDMKGNLFSAIIGAIVNIMLNVILIPLIGISGAAIATAVSYIIVLIYRYVDTQKYRKLNIFKTANVLIYIIIMVMMLISLNLKYQNVLYLLYVLLFVLNYRYIFGVLKLIKNMLVIRGKNGKNRN